MNLQAPPARLTQQQAAWYLGFQFHDIPTLVAAGLLKPLGKPVANGQKYFASVELARLRADTKWLARASDAITAHWRRKNHSASIPPNKTPYTHGARHPGSTHATSPETMARLPEPA